jgi:hypothetical protein
MGSGHPAPTVPGLRQPPALAMECLAMKVNGQVEGERSFD